MHHWAVLNTALDTTHGPISGKRKPQPQSWMSFGIGRTNFALSATMIRPKPQIRVELYITGEHAKAFFA